MYLFQDSELQQGKKHVLVVLAPDRTHSAFEAMNKTFMDVEKELDEIHNVRVFFEDHPGGYLHEKFDVSAQQFQWYLIDIHGHLVEHSDRPISVLDVLNRLKNSSASPSQVEGRFEPTH